jgi:hypothetical protein
MVIDKEVKFLNGISVSEKVIDRINFGLKSRFTLLTKGRKN